MRRSTLSAWCLAFYLTIAWVTNAANRGYIFTAPKRLIAGEIAIGCVSFHGGVEPPVDITLELVAATPSSPLNTNPATPASTSPSIVEEDFLGQSKATFKSGREACLELRVAPNTKYTIGKLRLKMKFEKHPDYVVEAEKKVVIEHDGLVSFIETDKPVYKPGQDVKIRILNLKHDLKPWLKSIPKVWIENPSEVRVAQWTNVTTSNGMAQLIFPLSPEPSSGIWKVKVEKTRPQLIHSTNFEVKKYVLPRFQVNIVPPNYILADAENATWKICARYSYGEPVKGSLVLSLRPQTPIWKRKQTIADINHVEKFGASSDGCTNYTVSAQILGLPHWKIAPNNVVLAANFTEAKSGVTETSISRTLVLHQPLKIEFSPHTPKRFKPGLPYNGRVRVINPDGSSPAPNENIQICLRIRKKGEWQRHNVECKNFTSSNVDGFLDFTVPPQPKNILLLSFVATAVDYPTKYYSPDKKWRVFVDQPSAYIDVEPWYSPSSSFLSVAQSTQPITCNETYIFNVMHTTSASSRNIPDVEPIAFQYSINSKGNLLVFGHVNYKKRNDSSLDWSEFPNLIGVSKSEDSVDLPKVHRFPLNVKITPSMSPVAELLVYFVRSDGEVVSGSQSIQVGQCFDNDVQSFWKQDKQAPGSKAIYRIQAATDSLCGVSVVDKSTKFLSSEKNLLDAETTFSRIKSFHLPAESAPIQASWAHCDKTKPTDDGTNHGSQGPDEEIDHLPQPAAAFVPKSGARRKRHSVTYTAGANYVDAIQAFDDFGTIVISDLILETRPCPPWRSSYNPDLFGGSMLQDIDEPDRMLKSVKAMPLSFKFAVGLPGMAAGEGAGAPSAESGYADPSSLDVPTTATLRSFFPETWLWDLVPVGPDGKVTLERELPHSITDWVANTVCVSKKRGLGISTPSQITSFQPFFLDYSLPYSVKRGEILHLKVSLFNYMQHSIPVKITLEQFEGLELDSNRTSHASFCLNSRDSVFHVFPLVPRVLGDLNITVSAEIDSEFESPESCGPEMLMFTKDRIVKPILVKAEGFPVEITNSALMCPKDFTDDSSLTWDLQVNPGGLEQVIEGSIKGHMSLIGDVFGPALDNLDKLVQLPMGCGEQNMILFVPNIHAISYLDAVSRQASADLRAKALRNMQKGYQRELNYRHPDGSYSAFGESDESGSMWLTAFVVKSFAQARSLIQIDERDLKLSVKWIVRRQLENGCFPVVGQVFHKDMKGGLREEDGSSSALTAYVLIALLESGVPLTATLVNNALYCLEKASTSDHFADNPYTATLTTYALALLEHPRANESLRSLMVKASTEKGLLWWEDKNRSGSLGLSIEMTSYAVLSLIKLGGESNMLDALKAVRWMSKKRNAEGGFTSTQDTVIGLEALTKYARAMVNATATDLSILVTATEVDKLMLINSDNKMVWYRIDLPVIPTTLEVFAEGGGCVLVQSSIKYNKAKALGSEAFDVSVGVEVISTFNVESGNDTCNQQQLQICSKYKLPDEESNMAVLEVDMVTGYMPDRSTLQDLLGESATGVKRFEVNGDKVAIYFEKLTAQKICVSFVANRENVVKNAKPGNIKLYDYYQQELTVSTTYQFIENCANSNNGDRKDPPHQEPMPRIMPMKDDDRDSDVFEIANKIMDQVGLRNKKIDPAVSTTARNVAEMMDPSVSADSLTEGSGSVSEPQIFGPAADRDVIEEGFSPAFVNVDHELDTPSGIEGPVTVIVPAPTSPISIISSFPKSNNSLPETPMNQDMMSKPSPEICPKCGDEIPHNFKDLYCASSSAVKVAIRRGRKTRLLLDLSRNGGDKRLRSTIEFTLKPECDCSSLDKPGTLAIILSKDPKQDFTQFPDKTKTLLKHSSHVYTVRDDYSGAPIEVLDARKSCLHGL